MPSVALYCMILKMSERITGAIIILLGLTLILTPWYIFPVCGKGRYAPKDGGIFQPHKCFNKAKAETALGIMCIAICGTPLIRPQRKALFACSVALFILAGMLALFPLKTTCLCKMPCRIGTLPALMLLSVLMALTAIGGIIQGLSLK